MITKSKLSPKKKPKGFDVKSKQELKLQITSIKRYKFWIWEGSRSWIRSFLSDFHLFKKDNHGNIVYDVYLEHFALDKNFKAPSYFDEEKGDKKAYEDNYYLKIKTMKDDGIDLISTFSHQFVDKSTIS